MLSKDHREELLRLSTEVIGACNYYKCDGGSGIENTQDYIMANGIQHLSKHIDALEAKVERLTKALEGVGSIVAPTHCLCARSLEYTCDKCRITNITRDALRTE